MCASGQTLPSFFLCGSPTCRTRLKVCRPSVARRLRCPKCGHVTTWDAAAGAPQAVTRERAERGIGASGGPRALAPAWQGHLNLAPGKSSAQVEAPNRRRPALCGLLIAAGVTGVLAWNTRDLETVLADTAVRPHSSAAATTQPHLPAPRTERSAHLGATVRTTPVPAAEDRQEAVPSAAPSAKETPPGIQILATLPVPKDIQHLVPDLGFASGDVIVHCDGQPRRSLHDLQVHADQLPGDQTVALLVWREGKSWKLSASAGQLRAALLILVAAPEGQDPQEALGEAMAGTEPVPEKPQEALDF